MADSNLAFHEVKARYEALMRELAQKTSRAAGEARVDLILEQSRICVAYSRMLLGTSVWTPSGIRRPAPKGRRTSEI